MLKVSRGVVHNADREKTRHFPMNVNFIIVSDVHQSLFKVRMARLIQRKSLLDNKVLRSGLVASAGVRQNDFLS